MATIYCEFCGQPANDKARDPERLVNWVHKEGKDVIRCWKHRGTSKLATSCRSHDPLTGQRREPEAV
jgi:hypothetical protein